MPTILSELINIIPELVLKGIKLIWNILTKQRRLKSILTLKKKNTSIIIPLRKGKLEDYLANYKFATAQEIGASLNIMKLLSVAGYLACDKFEDLCFGNENYAGMALKDKMSHNYISLGGPFGNSFACYILRRYFPSFQMSCGKNVYDACSKYEKPDFYIPHDDDKYYIKYLDKSGDEKYIYYNTTYQSNYIVMIKMTAHDFDCKKHGTIHLLWGGRADVTEASANVFLEYEHELYKRLRKHKKHYFIVCEYSKEFGMDFNKWYDITEDMF